jgi:hypothetical protein
LQNRDSRALYIWLVCFAAVLGLILRLVAAAGDLWLDEIWTLNLLKRAKTIGDIFFRIPYDNNHFLNSAWLWLAGPDAPAVVMRLAAVVFGTLSIPAAAAIGRRYCEASGVIAAFLIAVGYFFVHYGSEARGYAGMILAILLAYNALEGALEDENKARRYAVFALAICFGTFSHLTMAEATGVLCLTGAARLLSRGERLRSNLRSLAAIFIVAGLATAPAIACLLVGALSSNFHVGVMEPFSYQALAQGLADMARSSLGFPQGVNDVAVLTATAALALAFLALVPAHRRWFPALAVFGLPLLHAALRLPSQFYARFHLTAAVALILLTSDALAALWRRKGVCRMAAGLALALIAMGQAAQLANFFRFGRGAYVGAVKTMSERGPFVYSVDFLKEETKAVVGYEARRLGAKATAVEEADWCESAPDWLIVVNLPKSLAALPERKTAGPSACQTSFRRDRTFMAWGLSGFVWTLYRRQDERSPPSASPL